QIPTTRYQKIPSCNLAYATFRRRLFACFPTAPFVCSRTLFMALIKPFAALRPKPELASRLCELPYDVMSSAEARAIAAGNPLSFLHVSKPEIDLPNGTDVYSAP